MTVNPADMFKVECGSRVYAGSYSSGTPATLPTDLSEYEEPPAVATPSFLSAQGWADMGGITDAPDFSQDFEILEKEVWNGCGVIYTCRQKTKRQLTVSFEELTRTTVEMAFGSGVWTTTTNGVRFVPTGGWKEYRLALEFLDNQNRRFCPVFPRVGISEVSGPNADETCESMKVEVTFTALSDPNSTFDGVNPDMYILTDFESLVTGTPAAL